MEMENDDDGHILIIQLSHTRYHRTDYMQHASIIYQQFKQLQFALSVSPCLALSFSLPLCLALSPFRPIISDPYIRCDYYYSSV